MLATWPPLVHASERRHVVHGLRQAGALMADLCEWGCNTPLTPDDAHGLCPTCERRYLNDRICDYAREDYE